MADFFGLFNVKYCLDLSNKGSEPVQGGWYPIRKGRKDSQDEVSRSNTQKKTCWINHFLKM